MFPTRRKFIEAATAAWVGSSALRAQTPVAANDRIQIATIGVGGMGTVDTRHALTIPGVKLVAVSDLYDGRLTRAREVWGKDLFATRDYREILARRDVDAVIIATPDHWHFRITIDALRAGKDVYCEKPMVQLLAQGSAVVKAHQESDRILQVGSHYVSAFHMQKARELLRTGAIGQLTSAEASIERDAALLACQYSIPPDASPATIDWDRFLGSAPRHEFDAVRFFRWRNYRDYGTGIPGDLFVHLLSGLHMATESSGPTRVFATGGLRYWKDGRETPDVMWALLDYPATDKRGGFNVALNVNFKAGGGNSHEIGMRFVGTEGMLELSGKAVVLSKLPDETEPGTSIETFSAAMQEEFLKEYRKKYPQRPDSPARTVMETQFDAPVGFDPHIEHHRTFFAAVRSREQVLEDAAFGFRAAGPALLCNASYYEQRACSWDPDGMTAAG